MNSLAIDTSNKTLTVAVQLNNGIQKEIVIPDTLQHSVTLIPYISEVLQETNCSLAELDRIVVAKGPGSYTGLRVGVTVAKTLAYALQIDLIEVSSLAVLAANVRNVAQGREMIPFFDARRDHIFTGLYRLDAPLHEPIVSERYIAWQEWLAFLKERGSAYYFVGESDEVLQSAITSVLGSNVLFATGADQIPHANRLNEVAATVPASDSALAVPTYLKLAEAEENWRKEHGEYQEESYVERL